MVSKASQSIVPMMRQPAISAAICMSAVVHPASSRADSARQLEARREGQPDGNENAHGRPVGEGERPRNDRELTERGD
jgi:hypothetical protein